MPNSFEYNAPNTRARIAARRKRSSVPPEQSGVIPGPRRALSSWLSSGRIVSLPLLVVALVCLVYVTVSPRFQVSHVRVQGAQMMHESDLVDLSNAIGRSVWLLDTRQVEQAIQSNAYVEHVAVSLHLPDELNIRVQERRPELRWMSAGQLYLVDSDGRVLGSDSTLVMSNTLVIDDRSGRALKPNDHVDKDALTLGQALAVRLPADVHVQPAHIAWAVDTGIVVSTQEGRTIIVGRNERLDEKLMVVGQLIREGTAFTLLDLRPETPYYRNDTVGASGSPGSTP